MSKSTKTTAKQTSKPTQKIPATTATLEIQLGKSIPEQMNTLQKIQNCMTDIMVQNRADDGSHCSETMDLIEYIWFRAKHKMDELNNNNEFQFPIAY